MRKYFYLGICVVLAAIAVSIAVYGICVPDKLYMLLEAFLYIALSYIFYNEHKEDKEDGV